MSQTVKCTWCGNEFEAMRITAKFCSDACKMKHHRYQPAEIIEQARDAITHHIQRTMTITARAEYESWVVEMYDLFAEMKNLIDSEQRAIYRDVVIEENKRADLG